MTLKSPKQKGSTLERKVAQLIRRYGGDKTAKRMPLSGAFEGLKSDILTKLPYSFECKNQEKIQLYKWWEQAENDAGLQKTPVLVIKSNHRPIIACLKIEDLLTLIKATNEKL